MHVSRWGFVLVIGDAMMQEVLALPGLDMQLTVRRDVQEEAGREEADTSALPAAAVSSRLLYPRSGADRGL